MGPETLELNVSGIYDQNKNYTGPMVSSTVVTEKLASERNSREMADREREQAKDLQEKAVEEITRNIGAVAKAAQDTSEGAGHSQKTSTELSSMASSLQGVVGQFKY